MASLDIEVRLNALPSLSEEIHRRAALLIAKGAFDIEAGMKQRAAVDTGAMRVAISAITAASSDYDANVAAATSLNPSAVFAPPPQPADDLEAFVVAPAAYSAFVNYGTVHMPAQPFAEPAVEAVKPSLEQAWQELGG